MDRLFHFSAAPITGWQDRGQTNYFKPVGLWFAVGDDWAKHVSFEMPKWWDEYQYLYEVILADDCNLTRITSENVLEWSERFGVIERLFDKPRWWCVAKNYQGIIVEDYNAWLECPWLHPWDTASGCIWDKAAVKELKLLNLAEYKERLERGEA